MRKLNTINTLTHATTYVVMLKEHPESFKNASRMRILLLVDNWISSRRIIYFTRWAHFVHAQLVLRLLYVFCICLSTCLSVCPPLSCVQ